MFEVLAFTLNCLFSLLVGLAPFLELYFAARNAKAWERTIAELDAHRLADKRNGE